MTSTSSSSPPTSSSSPPQIPTKMRAWTFSSRPNPTLELAMELSELDLLPVLKKGEVLVRVQAAGLNPADHKFPELASGLLPLNWLFRKLFVALRGGRSGHVVPGMDFAGEVVGLGEGGGEEEEDQESRRLLGKIEIGSPVLGRTLGGTLSEYIIVGFGDLIRIPEVEVQEEGGGGGGGGNKKQKKKQLLLTMEEAASLPTAGLTAYQTLVPYLLKGTDAKNNNNNKNNSPSSSSSDTKQMIQDFADRNRNANKNNKTKVLINGASGGVGSFSVQIASRALNCHVTAVCSSRNEKFVREELGADEVLDYTKGNLLDTLSQRHGGGEEEEEEEEKFSAVVDNVGSPRGMANNKEAGAGKWMKKNTTFVQIGAGFGFGDIVEILKRAVFGVGGEGRKWEFIMTRNSVEDLEQLVSWIGEGKVKPIVAKTFEFEEAREAFAMLRTQRTRGKVVVRVGGRGREEEQ